MKEALTVNREIYDILSCAATNNGIVFWEPGSGTIHQVNLENYAVPGTLMIETDSITLNAGRMERIAIGIDNAG